MKGWQLTLFASAVAIVASSTLTQDESDNSSQLKEKALDAAVKEFNKKTPLVFAFTVQSVEVTDIQTSLWDTFFQLRFTIKQTNCMKKDFHKDKCKTWRKGGFSRKCFACFKFSTEDQSDSFVDCVPPPSLNQKREENWEIQCKKIKEKTDHLPGVYSFSKSRSN
ncbi:retinoic acid receptor responder protein 2-like [Latimeria chalumnae]|uniref:retinoic acid receptor responder protein 2-like n=1 Tax=Latimeria chalumnae TaxID=7897 RepID=UPI0003C192AE|nr:PREDICTED: retinoic acid receptor responder protein 2-like [Latimeria chalumnae]|eukprot:XP_006011973.1 PREDICTED: retinoic acid receptor responder protein 2-like [Latimeria chalumnae]